jgi:hypothetical protein
VPEFDIKKVNHFRKPALVVRVQAGGKVGLAYFQCPDPLFQFWLVRLHDLSPPRFFKFMAFFYYSLEGGKILLPLPFALYRKREV